jgi:hypothetical protein
MGELNTGVHWAFGNVFYIQLPIIWFRGGGVSFLFNGVFIKLLFAPTS